MPSRQCLIIVLFLCAIQSGAEPEDTGKGTGIIKKVQEAFYYAGENQRVLVDMQLVNSRGDIRRRELTYLRTNLEEGEQRYYLYFHSPSDIKDTAFLIWKYPDREDDRWLYIPSIKLVKRIAAEDKSSSFVGSDFTYEDVSGRDVEDEEHRLLREDKLDGRPVYVVESKPTTVYDYVRRVNWIDKERYLPLKEEFYDVQDQLARVFTADSVEQINGIWTVTRRTMKNVARGHRTEVIYKEVEYNLDLPEALFTERSLRAPPRRWVH